MAWGEIYLPSEDKRRQNSTNANGPVTIGVFLVFGSRIRRAILRYEHQSKIQMRTKLLGFSTFKQRVDMAV